MSIDNVINRFMLISGISEDEASKLSGICSESYEYINGITDISDSEANTALLENAAASLSFYKYTLYLAGSGRLRGFTAGDVTFDSGEAAVKYALELWLQARTEISDYIVDKSTGFAFLSV